MADHLRTELVLKALNIALWDGVLTGSSITPVKAAHNCRRAPEKRLRENTDTIYAHFRRLDGRQAHDRHADRDQSTCSS